MIQKLEQYVIGANYGCGGASFSEVIDKVNEVIDYINSLPEEKPSEDLEEAAENLFETIEIQEHENIFEDTFKKIFIAGAERQKAKMMKDAVEGEIGYWNQRGLSIRLDQSLEKLGYSEDTEVKIIIVKEDQK